MTYNKGGGKKKRSSKRASKLKSLGLRQSQITRIEENIKRKVPNPVYNMPYKQIQSLTKRYNKKNNKKITNDQFAMILRGHSY
ncbi:MAG: hypothetical protein ACPGXZ_00755 [Saprospiraceae bacterium]